ncbi:MAG: M1 family aminopeptidase, partial [Proteobacteria bacterium]|nr:M1 family aminopeptidase [Pseudomonadota bacterium]
TGSTAAGHLIRHTFATTRPLPTYLLAFIVGPYDVVVYDDIPPTAIRERAVPLRGIAAKGQGEQLRYALSHTAGLLERLEDYFGMPYPYRKLDLIATPAGFGGAMENVGAIIYDEWLLLLDENAAIDQRRAFFATHAHELAHMWFGDLVTPDWWTDIWLNESFATWMSYKIAQSYWPAGEFDRSLQRGAIGAMANDSLANAREIREIVSDNDRITDSFDGITYQKGGGILGMIERYAGEENFRQGIRYHLSRYADSTANAPQFMESLALGAELREIEPVFASFIEQAGVPLVSMAVSCEAEPVVKLTQSRYAPLGSGIQPDSGLWQIPVCLKSFKNGSTSESCHLLREPEAVFPINGPCPTLVFPNAGGTGYYRFSVTDADWIALIRDTSMLDGSEALSLLDSLDAAFRAGTLSAERYLQGLSALAAHQDWTVVDSVAGYLEGLDSIFSSEDLPLVRKAYRQIMTKAYERATMDGPDILLERLQRFMLIVAAEPALRAPLAEKAAIYIGFDGPADTTVVTPGQLETVLSIGVQDLGEPYFDQLLEMAIRSNDPAFRADAIGALARVEDPVLIAKLQAAIAAGQFRGTENSSVMARQMVRTASSDLTYTWLKSNPAELLRLLPETFRPTIAPWLANSLCSREKVAEWQQILELHRELIPGYERSMQQVVENNQLCTALRDHSRLALLSGLTNAGG